ncbi:hypothetical protein [Chryseobacterium indoltheticum]|uniref:Uncharacterized protein n=1 Tax=Chryseobacterium indoltheticum TaxID=254 RepID=A0A381FA40_9FLAO|nr:hypothetical protein [Chryseobacterium indoltheticum]SIR25175.1 hypothetical protein SAMN05421682_115125 [Chryseobacterium indoltheticum]SUX43449.1 Uncharacterised protein [Chryseobacterium indoltheticum]
MTKVQKKSNRAKKVLKSILKSFIRIDKIPITENGKTAEYCTMYVFGIMVCSDIYPSKVY